MDNHDKTIASSFQPSPKRFMVWNKKASNFLSNPNNYKGMFNLSELSQILQHHQDFMFIQSTNLYDKDGKEIFEGSIVKGKNYIYEVVFTYGGFYAIHDSARVGYIETPLYALLYHEGGAEVIGHILSSPELLEGTK